VHTYGGKYSYIERGTHGAAVHNAVAKTNSGECSLLYRLNFTAKFSRATFRCFCSCIITEQFSSVNTAIFSIITRQEMYVQREVSADSRNYCYRIKEITTTYSECVFVATVIQHAKRMRRIVMVARPALHYCSTLPHKRRVLKKKKF
jgi:hypothetical protein